MAAYYQVDYPSLSDPCPLELLRARNRMDWLWRWDSVVMCCRLLDMALADRGWPVLPCSDGLRAEVSSFGGVATVRVSRPHGVPLVLTFRTAPRFDRLIEVRRALLGLCDSLVWHGEVPSWATVPDDGGWPSVEI